MTTFLNDHSHIGSMIDDLRRAQSAASEAFEAGVLGRGDPDYETVSNAAWNIEIAFLKLLTVTEILGLNELHRLILGDLKRAKSKMDGLADSADGVEEPYSIWLSRYRQYISALETLGGVSQEQSVTKDLTEVLRATVYPITDTNLFTKYPASENDVHRRIEGILRCVFPDLKHKPTLTKPIKNFEPDTGLPSIRTLIEYKFIDSTSLVGSIADQILADTRGYASRDWNKFVYVLYETSRIRPEHEWNQLLRECGVSDSTSVIVLSGMPSSHKKNLSAADICT